MVDPQMSFRARIPVCVLFLMAGLLTTPFADSTVIGVASFQRDPSSDADKEINNVPVDRVLAETIVAHLQTGIQTQDFAPDDRITFEIFGEDLDHAALRFEYTTGSSTIQDVGVLHDSIYITPVPIFIEEIRITVHASGCRPGILDGSWIELKGAHTKLEVTRHSGSYASDPASHLVYYDNLRYGQLGQLYLHAHGYNRKLGANDRADAYNMKEFAPLDTVSETRKADILMRVSWAGTGDKDVVSPAHASFGWYLGAGISAAPPPQRVIAEEELDLGGDPPVVTFAESVSDLISSAIIEEVGSQVFEEVCGEALPPGASEIKDCIKFLYDISHIDERTGGTRWLKFKDVRLDQNSWHYAWIALAARAEASIAAHAYVNFMYQGDPQPADYLDHDEKGIWLHDVLVYYQPMQTPHVTLEEPTQRLYPDDPNNLIQFSAGVSDGTAPYEYEWTATTTDPNGGADSVQILHTSGPEYATTSSFDSSLGPGTHWITVKVTDSEGGTDTDSVRLEVLPVPDPPVVTGPDAAVTEEWFHITWPRVDGVHHYVVEESIDNSPWYSYPSQTWHYRAFIGWESQTHFYRVTVYDRLGQSATSAEIPVQVDDPPYPEFLVTVPEIPESHGSGVLYGLNWEFGEDLEPHDYGWVVREYEWSLVGDPPTSVRDQTVQLNYAQCPNLYADPNTGKGMCKTNAEFLHFESEKTYYEYEVFRLKPDANEGPGSNTVGTWILPPPATAPRLAATPNSVSPAVYYSIERQGDVLGAEEYRVDEDTDPAFSNPVTGWMDPSTYTISFVHDPPETTTYYYRVAARNSGGLGPWSDTISKTVSVGIPPAKPVLEATRSVADPGESYTLEWNHVDAERGYMLQESRDRNFGASLTTEFVYGAPVTSRNFSNAPAGATYYYYRVRGFAPDVGQGPWSDPVRLQVLGTDAPVAPVLHHPDGIALPGQKFEITWDEVPEAASYWIEESSDPTFPWPPQNPIGSMPAGTTSTGYLEYSPSVTTNYYYRIRVLDPNGLSSGWSNTVVKQVAVPDCDAMGVQPPATPQNIRIVPSTGYAGVEYEVIWDPVDGVMEYELLEDDGDASYCDFYTDQAAYLGEDQAATLVRPFVGGVGYCYKVRAWNSCRAGEWSQIVDIGCPTVYTDADGDGYGVTGTDQFTCVEISGTALEPDDCDDADPEVYPGAPELCDGVVTDCNDPYWPYPMMEVDLDLDGFYECDGDCDDQDHRVYPGAPEVCDGVNNDCDDPSWPSLAVESDDDGDGYSECSGDCDDTRALAYPGAAEVCDGILNDCNDPSWPSLVNSMEADDDGDGFSECGGDCDDTVPYSWGWPAAVTGLNVMESSGVPWFYWDSQEVTAGVETAYDVYGGVLGTLLSADGDFSTGFCWANNHPAPALEFMDIPPPGEAYYLVIRAQNSCGPGTYGDSSRDAEAAASSSPCN